jgi:hypothetical protein
LAFVKLARLFRHDRVTFYFFNLHLIPSEGI